MVAQWPDICPECHNETTVVKLPGSCPACLTRLGLVFCHMGRCAQCRETVSVGAPKQAAGRLGFSWSPGAIWKGVGVAWLAVVVYAVLSLAWTVCNSWLQNWK